MERPASFSCMRLDLAARGGKCVLERLLELCAKALEPCAQLLALGSEPVGVRCDPQLGFGDEVLLPLHQIGDVQLRRLCGAVQILRPAGEALLDLGLRDR